MSPQAGVTTFLAVEGFWRDHGTSVLTVAATVATVVAIAFVVVVRRVRREVATLAAEALASLAGHVAMLDRGGTILAVNDAWSTFGLANGLRDPAAIGPGVNYLDVCDRGALAGELGAAPARDGIRAVCTGERREFELEYRSEGPHGIEWYQMKVTRRHGLRGGAVVSHRNITEIKQRDAVTREREITGRLVAAHEEERRRIARELHDDIQQRLALLAIGIERTGAVLDADEALRASMGELSRQVTEVATAVHTLSHELHPSLLETLGLVPAVRKLAREISAQGLHVTVSADETCSRVPAGVALGVFRVIQEALSNTLRHSGATAAAVTLRRTGDDIAVSIRDQGRGFDLAAERDGLGLVSMRERLTTLGGEVRVVSAPGAGTAVEARVPITFSEAVASPS